MDLTPLKLYRSLIPFKEKADASTLFKRICTDLINERIAILKAHGLISFYGGESKIKKELGNKLVTPADIERENELNEKVNSVLKKYKDKLKGETTDFRPLFGFLVGKKFDKATFSNLEKTLNSLPKTSKAYISNKLRNEPCILLTNAFKPLDSYHDIPELVAYVNNQPTKGDLSGIINSKSHVRRASFITSNLVPIYHFLTKEQVDKILNEASKERLSIIQKAKTRSTKMGIFGFTISSLVFFFGFFFLSLLATFWGYSQFGREVAGKVTDSTNYGIALFGMIFILPAFFLATFFGAYERRWMKVPYEDHLILQIAPRFIPSVTLILHAILLFSLTKNPQGEAYNNIFNKVFYLGDKGYTLALIYIFIAVTTLVMDLFSFPAKGDLIKWNSKGYLPGRLWLTQNGSLYIFPFVFLLRLFMPSISLAIMVALTILTFIFGLAGPIVIFVIKLFEESDEKGDPDLVIYSSILLKGIVPAAIFMLVMFFTYFMMTNVHANPNWFSGKWAFFPNLGWFLLLSIIIAACLVGLAQLTSIDAEFLDISPSFYFFIIGFILLFIIGPKGSEDLPNIYYRGEATAPMFIFIISLMILSVFHDVCCFIFGEYDFSDSLCGSKVTNLGFILAAISLYVFSGAIHIFPLYVLAIATLPGMGTYYIYTLKENDSLSLFDI